jgi:uncharacterized protein YigE (DUF2233 family)
MTGLTRRGRLMLLRIVAVLCGLASLELPALDFSDATIGGQKATICRVKVATDKLTLFFRDEHGMPLKSFEGIERWLAPRGQKLIFGMNAGMFHGDLSPVGLCIVDGRQLAPLNLARGEGNFFLKPNGVFYVSASGAHVVEASEFARVTEPASLATQSGPMLVLNGKLHPAFNPKGESRLARNGVGVVSPDTAIFVIVREPVNFYDFASFFRDTLKCPNALFLDGTLSSLHAPTLKHSDKLIDLGPIVGVVAPRD